MSGVDQRTRLSTGSRSSAPQGGERVHDRVALLGQPPLDHPGGLQVVQAVGEQVRGHDLIKMMTADGRTTGLGHAFKSMHLLHAAHPEDYRRMMDAH
ncbi:hypothetical protein ABZ912_53430 [Nonomuraea angiospora]|uniref:hypothetical protein n=1 Tax=Nonomuraea angiospora TaxID=46172 RepID=UPI0033F563C1